MEKYSVYISPAAKRQLNEIVKYIINDLSNPLAGLGFLDSFETSIKKLEYFPEAYVLAERKIFKNLNVRRLIFKSFNIYYKVDSKLKRVDIIAITYAKSDQYKQLYDLANKLKT